ncbi:hypothetical protein [Rhizobium arsenicireducens]
MKMPTITSQLAFGDLPEKFLRRVLTNVKSPHQFQKQNAYIVLFLMPMETLQFDRQALSKLVEVAQTDPYRSDPALCKHLVELLTQIQPQPKPEPEVTMSKPKTTPKPAPEETWAARVRVKFYSGRIEEVEKEIRTLADLQEIISGLHPQNVKIKLERLT